MMVWPWAHKSRAGPCYVLNHLQLNASLSNKYPSMHDSIQKDNCRLTLIVTLQVIRWDSLISCKITWKYESTAILLLTKCRWIFQDFPKKKRTATPKNGGKENSILNSAQKRQKHTWAATSLNQGIRRQSYKTRHRIKLSARSAS